MTLKRILLPTDFSDTADSARGHAQELVERFQASLHLLHVIARPGVAGLGGGEQGPKAEERLGELSFRGHRLSREGLARPRGLGPEARTPEGLAGRLTARRQGGEIRRLGLQDTSLSPATARRAPDREISVDSARSGGICCQRLARFDGCRRRAAR